MYDAIDDARKGENTSYDRQNADEKLQKIFSSVRIMHSEGRDLVIEDYQAFIVFWRVVSLTRRRQLKDFIPPQQISLEKELKELSGQISLPRSDMTMNALYERYKTSKEDSSE